MYVLSTMRKMILMTTMAMLNVTMLLPYCAPNAEADADD